MAGPKWRPAKSLVLATLLFAAPLHAQSAYDTIVAPLFNARCADCHGAEKQKGKLALHTWEGAAKGGDSGPLWVAGNPAESELVRRLKLPLDDEEHMPPREEPQLSAEEVALLVRWIEAGASREQDLGALKLSAPLARAAAELAEKIRREGTAAAKDPTWEPDVSGIATARAALVRQVGELQREFPGALTYESRASARLHFTAAGLGREFGDAQLARLASLAAELVVLDLSGTSVTDRGAAMIAAMRELRVLRLNSTAVTDATLGTLKGLEKLEVLALHDTGVSPAGLEGVAQLKALRRLHVMRGPLAEAAGKAGLPVVAAGAEALDVPVPKAATDAPAPTATPKSE